MTTDRKTACRPASHKPWKEVMYKDVNDLYIKPIDAMDRGKWRKMIRGNWSDSQS